LAEKSSNKKKTAKKESKVVSKSSEAFDISLKSLNFLKNYWPLIILIIILIAGLSFRIYHIDYPVVGYHNWKSVHYLSEARNFAEDGFFTHGFFIPEHDYPLLNQQGNGAHGDTFPVISIIVAIMFKIFGPNLVAARMVGILFSLGTIVMLYYIIRRLFNSEILALTVAAVTAINPLFIFFSHNIQLMNPGVFFMLTAFYFYLRWIDDLKAKDMIWTAVFLALAFLTKYPFAIILVPMIFLFPYKQFKTIIKDWKNIIISLVILSTTVIWFFYAGYISNSLGGAGSISEAISSVWIIFTAAWWAPIKAYLADNYTMMGVTFAILGLVISFFTKANKKAKLFLYGYVVGLIIYVLIMAGKMQGHSYHQFPIAPLFIILIAYFFVVVAQLVSSFIKHELVSQSLKILIVVVFFIFLFSPSMEAKDRQFNTQFIGLDIAGEFIKENSEPWQTMVNSGQQDYGVLWHADMKGIKGVINHPLVNLIRAENEYNSTWIFLYQWGLAVTNEPEKWTYIQQNYHLRQFAYIEQGAQAQALFMVLEKGGSFNASNINNLLAQEQVHTREYEYTYGKVPVKYINLN
jgi:4-amino-4-deoxy-L-arabinose transferase-like glycosyltransferase